MNERRRTDRRRVYLAATIVPDPGRPSFDCIVKNLSATGAMIVVPPGETMPLEFKIVFTRTGEARRAVSEWRHQQSFGIRFCDAYVSDNPTQDRSLMVDGLGRTLLEERIEHVITGRRPVGSQEGF